MNYTLTILSEVEEDAVSAYHWYEEKSKGLGEDFLRIVYTSIGEITFSPLLFRKKYKNFRRCVLKRFPYVIYFVLAENEIMICGLFHSARSPDFIKNEIHNRKSQPTHSHRRSSLRASRG